MKNLDGRFWARKNVLVTGGAGFLGTHLVEKLREVKPKKITVPTIENYDLREYESCLKVARNQDLVIHLAANVGGIGYNREHPADLFDDNILMGTYMMRAAKENGVRKFVSLGTICAYPKFTPVPFKEKDLWEGYPEETNAPYGLAKKMQLVQAQAYRDQHGFNAIYLLPVNLYGPGDNFNPKSSHVIPALIRKFVEAEEEEKKEVVVWGTGKPTREFFYVKDAATGILLAAQNYDKPEPVNLGANFEISIKELANLIKELVGFKGKIFWDKTKPDGQPRRRVSAERARKEFGFKAETSFKEGLKETMDWFVKERP
jgi:GDP-L-fucose synthase